MRSSVAIATISLCIHTVAHVVLKKNNGVLIKIQINGEFETLYFF
jgi:hypothetical protein